MMGVNINLITDFIINVINVILGCVVHGYEKSPNGIPYKKKGNVYLHTAAIVSEGQVIIFFKYSRN